MCVMGMDCRVPQGRPLTALYSSLCVPLLSNVCKHFQSVRLHCSAHYSCSGIPCHTENVTNRKCVDGRFPVSGHILDAWHTIMSRLYVLNDTLYWGREGEYLPC